MIDAALTAVGADAGLLPPLPGPLSAEGGSSGLADLVDQPEEFLVDADNLRLVGSGPLGGQLGPALEAWA
jgi:hypothetical protein